MKRAAILLPGQLPHLDYYISKILCCVFFINLPKFLSKVLCFQVIISCKHFDF